MTKSAKEVALEAKLAKAQAGSETAVYDAQVEVYEGQITEARDAYTEAKAKRGKSRAKLPEEIPDEAYYKERLLQAQYSEGRARTQGDLEQVDNFVTGIRSQQQAKKTIKILDEQMPALLSSAEKEVETTNKRIETARKNEITNQMSLITGFKNQIFAEQTRIYNVASATNTKAIETEKKRVAKQINDFNKAETLRVSVLNKAEDARVLADNKLVANALSFVKADNKVKADIALKAETKRLDDIALKESKQRAKQDVIDRNAEFFASGKRFNDPKHSVHYGRLQGVPQEKGDVMYYAGGQFTPAYYSRASEVLGITYQQARQASDLGRRLGSKPRDALIRSFKDPTGASEALYQEHRRLAKKVTASARGAQKIKDAQASGTNTATDLYGSQSLMGTNVKAPQGNYTEQLQSAMRQQRTADLRAGNVGLATGLLDPVTAQKYTNTGTGESALSLTRKFLVERGYSLDNLDAVPNSVFKPVKYVKARKQATTSSVMGDLTTLVPKTETMSPIGKVATVMVNGTKNEYFAPIPNAELVKRKEASARLDKFKALEENYNMLKTATAGTITPTPKVRTITVPTISGKTFTANAPAVLQKKSFDTFGFDPIANQVNKNMNQSWTVTIPKDGAQYTADFKTKVEADLFVKEQTKQANIFSGTDNPMWNAFNKANAIDSGEIPMPTTTMGKLEYYSNVTNRPVITMGASIANLFQPQDKQIPVREVASGKLIGGTIDDVIKLDPLKGSGVKSAYEYAKADPLRTALELPAETVMWVTGGKAIQLGASGVSAGVSVSAKLGTKIIASSAPNIVKIPTMAVMGAGQTVQRVGTKVSSIPNKIGSKVYDYGTIPRGMKYGTEVFTSPQQVVRQGIIKPYNKLTLFEGDRVGFKAKADFVMTPSGRLFVRQSKEIGTDVMAKPQFLNRQVAMFESEGVTGFATRGKMKTTTYELPKEVPFKSDAFTPTAKTKLIPKEGYPKMDKPFPELYDSKLTTSGKPFPELVKVEDISVIKIETPNPFDRLKHSVFKDSETMHTIKKVKTAVDEVTFYSDTTGDLAKGVIRPKAELQGEGINYRGFEKPEITSTRTRLQDYKTSTSQPTTKGQLKFSDNTFQGTRIEGMIKLKGSPIRQIDTITTGAKLTGKKNLEIIDTMVEKGQIEEIGKKTVMKGEDYFGGGKKYNLKQELESRYPTTFESATGKIKPKDETILYNASKKTIPVDKKAFSQTMKESNLLRELDTPLNKKSTVPEGEPIPTSGNKLNVKKFAKEKQSNKSGQTLVTPTKQSIKAKSFVKVQSKLGVKKSPYSSAITGSAVITTAKSLPSTSTRIDSGVRIQEKISTKTQTGLKQDQGLVQETVIKQQTKSESRLRTGNVLSIKLDTGMKLQQKQKYAVMNQPLLKTYSTSSRPKGGMVILPKMKIVEKTTKGKRGKKAGFIGNVRLDNIMGMYKRKEITYGKNKVTKLERQDARLTSGTSNRIAMPASGLLKTKKKKKEKKTLVFGGGKDEFTGFGSKSKGKKKKSSLFG